MNSTASKANPSSERAQPDPTPAAIADQAPQKQGSLNVIAAVLVAVLGTGGMGTAWVQSMNKENELKADLKLEQGKRAESDKQLEANRLELAKKSAELEKAQQKIADLNEKLAKAKSETPSVSADQARVVQRGNYNAGIGSTVTRVR